MDLSSKPLPPAHARLIAGPRPLAQRRQGRRPGEWLVATAAVVLALSPLAFAQLDLETQAQWKTWATDTARQFLAAGPAQPNRSLPSAGSLSVDVSSPAWGAWKQAALPACPSGTPPADCPELAPEVRALPAMRVR